MNILVTGGLGFIGSNFMIYMLDRYPQYRFVNLDAMTYAANRANLQFAESLPNYRFVKGDIVDAELLDTLIAEEGIEAVVHFAAESHVDRSIADPSQFINTNLIGTYRLLEAARKHNIGKFVHISTDEVYGSLGARGRFTERTALAPNSPYSASKAGSDLLVRSYGHTFGLPIVITRCSNNYGPRQYPEKLIPLAIIRALNNEPIPVYGDGLNVRDWLHVEDHCRAIELVLQRGSIGHVYNIGGFGERTNLEVLARILELLGRPSSLLQYVNDRPGHDRRYAMNPAKITKKLGWAPQWDVENGLRDTVEWYSRNMEWWKPLLNVHSVRGKEESG